MGCGLQSGEGANTPRRHHDARLGFRDAISSGRQAPANSRSNPIPGLYAAGDCSAVLMPHYISGGDTLDNALTMGHVAGMNSATEPVR